MEKLTHELLDETIFIIFAELARFNKEAEECVSELDRMLYVLKNSDRLDNPAGWLKNPVYARILKAFEISKFSKTKRIQYNKDMYDERRRKGELKAARQDGLEAGFVRGKEEGRHEERLLMATNMKQQGLPIEIIGKITGLSVKTIADL